VASTRSTGYFMPILLCVRVRVSRARIKSVCVLFRTDHNAPVAAHTCAVVRMCGCVIDDAIFACFLCVVRTCHACCTDKHKTALQAHSRHICLLYGHLLRCSTLCVGLRGSYLTKFLNFGF
jgi:hypothetical protein